ncbi:MAG: BrxA/BrxB family bacilliredoxin [Gemmatimonadales bacterium]|nr:BrxA/BrxB family bacilliredoxin [Gemmatimonadales bacterium]MYG50717.1 BrxA/BrxB family bacilliredoxin [Gemmatimonadales bacterium]MYK02677.1 BrxA/BrxB family bacilliredoxin [Candidatus Palauibacter ramosifaciens]
MLYDPRLVQPMRDELTRLGVRELRTSDEVDEAFEADGETLVVVNSVCGCAARNARPAVAMAMNHDGKQPDRVVTVFAGQDVEATARARQYFTGVRPSSPSLALLSNGELQFMLERHQIEGREARDIAADLTKAYDRYCATS